MRSLRLCASASILFTPLLYSHVGSPDVFYEGAAGPYRLFVTIRPPQAIPGVAEVEIRSASPAARQIHIVPLRLTGVAANLAPLPDLARPSKDDPQFFTGSLWLMAHGPWKVRIDVDGSDGAGTISVPVPALATRVLGMQTTIAAILIPLGLLLSFGVVSIVGAATREALLDPGVEPDAAHRRRSRIAMVCAAAVVVTALWFANAWWGLEDSTYRQRIYKPLELSPAAEGSKLLLNLSDPGWLNRRTDDLIPDHGHLMHLYVIHLPQMDHVFHLHPERTGPSGFTQQLPPMRPGRYALYGDIVHAGGLAETAAGEIDLPAINGQPLTGDDAEGPTADGYQISWLRDAAPLHSRQPYDFRFRLLDDHGAPANNVELYMGMLGHAAFIRDDRSVFAHVHPFGSVAMPALELAQPADPHAGHSMPSTGLPAEVTFPYGFPKPGNYRIIVQMKAGSRIHTGIFDAHVEN